MERERDRRDPLVIVAGPTAAGKSAAAVQLARDLHGEVISADSMQVYRSMDIGSAKVTAEEMEGVPHHLIDVCDPTEDWNVVRFQSMARDAAADIRSRGRLPIVAGGTGFYIQALLYDIDFTQMATDGEYRAGLERIAAEQGGQVLWERLAQVDPKSAQSIHPNNVKRVIRALEFAHESGGERISAHNERQRQREAAYDAVYFVLTMDRERLYERIDRRVDLMMEQGLVAEVERLQAQGLTDRDVSMQGLGYKQILWALDGQISLEEAVRIIKRDTRHFAKRQLTWFRRERDVIWVRREDFADSREMLAWMENEVRERTGWEN